jgi:hypothetical protein
LIFLPLGSINNISKTSKKNNYCHILSHYGIAINIKEGLFFFNK